jgi:hypothetical protein
MLTNEDFLYIHKACKTVLYLASKPYGSELRADPECARVLEGCRQTLESLRLYWAGDKDTFKIIDGPAVIAALGAVREHVMPTLLKNIRKEYEPKLVALIEKLKSFKANQQFIKDGQWRILNN